MSRWSRIDFPREHGVTLTGTENMHADQDFIALLT